MTLKSLQAGETATIKTISPGISDLLTELLEYGLLPGKQVACDSRHEAMEKMVLRVGGVKIALRFSELDKIEIHP